MANLAQLARDAKSNQLKDMLHYLFEKENELDFTLSRKMSHMVWQYTDRVGQRLDLIAELKKLQGSILSFETVKLLRDVNDADLSKVRAFMTAISQIQVKCYVDDAHYDTLLIFYIHGRGLHFGRHEFSLIIGLKITSLDLIGVLEDEEFFSKICDEDAIRVCLLLSLEVIFMGRKLVHEFDDTLMRLVENLKAWNAFPWVEHIWIHLYKQMLNVVSNHKAEHLKGLHMSRNYVPTYTLSGFVWSFKIWILESFERSNCWWSKDSEVIPRGLAWSRRAIFKSTDLSNLFCKDSKPTVLVLVRKTKGVVVDKLEFSEDFPNLSPQFCDELNKEFVDLFDSPSISSGTCYSDLDIDEDADEEYLLKEQFRMKLEEEEMLFKEEQILKEESRLRLEEEAKMMREEENMLEEEKIHKKDYKKRELILMNSDHMKQAMARVVPKKRSHCTGVTSSSWLKDLSRCNTSIDNVWLTVDLDLYLGKPGMLCWLLDDHIDLWVEYMWHVRPKSANWAMVSSYFVQLLLQNSMPIWYANGETYNLPWSAVEQVFIPLNEPGEHWNLAKFDFCSGLVTFYDSGDTYAIECRDWYIRMTNCLKGYILSIPNSMKLGACKSLMLGFDSPPNNN
ncbi:phospholipase-like protein [Tanacetum coccineum]